MSTVFFRKEKNGTSSMCASSLGWLSPIRQLEFNAHFFRSDIYTLLIKTCIHN